MAGEIDEGVSYNPSGLVDMVDLLDRIVTVVTEINAYTLDPEFMDFTELLETKASLKLDGPEEEHNNQLFDMDVSNKAEREEPGSMMDGVLTDITTNVDMLMMTLEHIQILVNTSMEYSDGEVQRNHHRDKTKKISAEREARANRKHMREVVNHTELAGGGKRPFITGKINRAKDVVPAMVGAVMRAAFRIARKAAKTLRGPLALG